MVEKYSTIVDEFSTNSDPMSFEVTMEEHDVPGWMSFRDFLQNEMSIQNQKALEQVRRFYNHYLKRFPVHYFTQTSIPDIDFVLFFPVRTKVKRGKTPHYLVAISQDKKLVLFHQNLWHNIKTRQSFSRLTQRWLNDGFKNKKISEYDIGSILDICEDPEELLKYRTARFSGFLDKLSKKLKRKNQLRYFDGKWDAIKAFLEERDRYFIYQIIGRLKNKHVSFEAARRVADISDNNLDIYNWIMAGADAEKVRNRMQLAEHYPWLAQALGDQSIAPSYKEIERIIDNGESLISALSDFFTEQGGRPVSQAVVRKTARFCVQNQKLLMPENMSFILGGIKAYLPRLKLAEGGLERLYDGQEKSRRLCDSLNVSFAEILGSQSDERQHEILSLPEDEFQALVKDYSDTADFLQQVYATLVMPYFAYRASQAGLQGLGDVIRNYLRGGETWDVAQSYIQTSAVQDVQPPSLRPFGNRAVHNIIKLSQAWHADLKKDRVRMYSVQIDRDLSWPVLFNEISAENGVKIRALASKADLQREHNALGHCILHYAPHCLGLVEQPGRPRSFSHAFSLVDGRDRATLVLEEPVLSDGAERLTVCFGEIDGRRKVKDVRNPPSKESRFSKAAEWLVQAINDNGISSLNKNIHQQRSQRHVGRSMTQLSMEAEFDVSDFAKCEEAFKARRHYLPNRYRNLSYREWIEKMGFDQEADKLFGAQERDLSLGRLMQIGRQTPAPGADMAMAAHL